MKANPKTPKQFRAMCHHTWVDESLKELRVELNIDEDTFTHPLRKWREIIMLTEQKHPDNMSEFFIALATDCDKHIHSIPLEENFMYLEVFCLITAWGFSPFEKVSQHFKNSASKLALMRHLNDLLK